MITNVDSLRKPEEVKKMDSFEDIARQDLEEGKTSSVSDFIIRSPNIQKKKMDFGQGMN